MAIWVFNDGTYKHRGVWHAVNSLVSSVVPEKVVEKEYDAWRYHSKSCEWSQARWTGNEWYVYVDYIKRKPKCSCELSVEDEAVSLGKYTERHITPEHTEIGPQDVLCGQVRIRDSGLSPVYRNYSKKVKPGDVLTLTDRVRNMVFEGDLPPGPTCSRCEKKLNDA